MIPVNKFFVSSNCPDHGETDFEVQFLSYDPITHKVKYFICCVVCIAEVGDRAIGYSITCASEYWNKWTPLCDEPKVN